MSYQELLDFVFKTAQELYGKGPGWAQQSTVLSEVAKRLSYGMRDELVQQRILTCWHDLFRLGRLSWGYNLDNPDGPFYHVPQSEEERDSVR